MESVTNEKKQHKRPLWVRVLALFLAVLLLSQAVLINAAKVSFSKEKYEGSEFETAATLLEEDDAYMNASLLERMRAIIQHVKKPQTYDEYTMFASVAIADEDYDSAEKYLMECIRLLESREHSTEELSALYLRTGCVFGLNSHWDQAVGYLRNAAVKDSSNANAWLMLAEANLRCNNYADALDAMNRFTELQEPDAEQLQAMATMELVTERFADCIEHCTLLLDMEGTDPAGILTMRAQAYLLSDESEKAIADAEAAMKAGGNEKELLPIEANAYELTEDYENALKLYKQAVECGDADVQTLYHGVNCAYLLDRYDEMYSFSQKALSLELTDNEKLEFRKWLGIAQLEKEEYKEAAENLSAYMEVNTEMSELYYLRGVCYMAEAEYESAIDDFSKSIKAEILIDECLYNRGLCHSALGNQAEAAFNFQAIIKRNTSPELIKMTKEFLNLK